MGGGVPITLQPCCGVEIPLLHQTTLSIKPNAFSGCESASYCVDLHRFGQRAPIAPYDECECTSTRVIRIPSDGITIP